MATRQNIRLPFQCPSDEDHHQRKSESQADDNPISEALAQRNREASLPGGHGEC